MLGALKVAFYLIVAVVAARAAHREKNDAPLFTPKHLLATVRSCLRAIRERGLRAPPRAWRAFGWLCIATVCVLLAIARVIDVDHVVRAFVVSSSAYADRRGPQQIIILITASTAALVVAFTVFRLRRSPRLAAGLAASLTLTAYVTVRAVSLHAVDVVIGHALLGVRINTWIEAGLLAVIVAASSLPLHQPVSSKQAPQ